MPPSHVVTDMDIYAFAHLARELHARLVGIPFEGGIFPCLSTLALGKDQGVRVAERYL